ncbi:hypothetical protein LCGC14_2252450, partial [marine sediment metagenome]
MKTLGLGQRIRNLREFIEDGKLLHFAPLLLSNLQGQLTILVDEQTKDKAKRDNFYKSINIQKCINVVQKCNSPEVLV